MEHHDNSECFHLHNSSPLKHFEDACKISAPIDANDYTIAIKDDLPPSHEVSSYSDVDSFNCLEKGCMMSLKNVYPYSRHLSIYDSGLTIPPSSHNKDLLLIALLDHLSEFYAGGEHGQLLFQVLIESLRKAVVLPSEDSLTSMEEFTDLRSQYKDQFSRIVRAALLVIKQQDNTVSSPPNEFILGNRKFPDIHLPLKLDVLRLNNSRYEKEFIEKRLLGQGAFGSVFEVCNKLDGCSYAVKKVVLYGQKTEMWFKLLREVKLLAPLSHKHIVRYHAAWMEYLPVKWNNILTDSSPSIQTTIETPCSLTPDNNAMCKALSTPTSDRSHTDGDSIVFESSSNVGKHSSENDEFPCEQLTETSEQSFDVRLVALSGCRSMEQFIRDSCVVLYIQMELCSITLKQWIQARNSKCTSNDRYKVVCVDDNSTILRHLLKALEHIHNNGLIHRDIKPKNIFFTKSEQLHVKVGDFGLSRMYFGSPMTPHPGLSSPPNKMENVAQSEHDLTASVGTTIYASPEQLYTSEYDYKSDMYSVGILLYELYQPFLTEMERRIALNDLRSNSLPTEFVEQWPSESHIIASLLRKSPNLRPSASTLLNSQLFYNKDQIIQNLEAEVNLRDKTIEDLKMQLKTQKQEIYRLTKRSHSSQEHTQYCARL